MSQGLGWSAATPYLTNETSPNILMEPYQRKVYYLPDPSPDYTIKYTYQDVFGLVGSEFNDGDDLLLYSSSHHTLSSDSIKMYRRFDFEQPIQIYPATAKIPLGFGPPRWAGRLYNRSDADQVSLSHDPIHAFGYFVSPVGDVWASKLPYRLLRDGQLLQSDSLLNRTSGAYYDNLSVPGDAYELQIGFDKYSVLDTVGRALAKLRFDTRKPDGNPPYIKSLRVLSNGRDAVALEPGNQNEIRLSVRDDNLVTQLKLFYRAEDSQGWVELPVIPQGSLWTAPLTFANRGNISIRVYAEDPSGNTLTYDIEPAFRMGTPPNITAVSVSHGYYYLRPGDSVTVSARVTDDDGVGSVLARIKTSGDTVIAAIPLYDDGQHNDGQALDSIYGGTWKTPPQKADYSVDIVATDLKQNTTTRRNAVTFSTKDVPYVILDRFEFYNNPDGKVSQGEFVQLKAYLKNVGTVRANGVTLKIPGADPYIRFTFMITWPSVNFGSVEAGASVSAANQWDIGFQVSELTRHNQTISVSIEIADAEGRKWQQKLSFTAIDDVGPFITAYNRWMTGRSLAAGSPALIKMRFADGSGIRSIMAYFYNGATNTLVDSIQLFDDGFHQDEAARDGWYANLWTTPNSPANYEIDFLAVDSLNNQRRFVGRLSTMPVGRERILIISDAGVNRSSFIMNEYSRALSQNNLSFDSWDCYYAGTPDSALLAIYSRGVVVWGVGEWGYLTAPYDSDPPYSTIRALSSFMNRGGRLLVSGRNIARDLQNDANQRSYLRDLFHAQYLGKYVRTSVAGVPVDPVFDGLSFSLASGQELDDIQPIAPAMTSLQYIQGGVAGLRAETSKHKILYLPFDFAEIREEIAKRDLTRRAIAWLSLPPTGIEQIASDLPKEYALHQNYPNPFNPSTIIAYDLPKESRVSLKVYNILGQKVADVAEDMQPPGRYQVVFDAAGLSSGVYFYNLQAGAFSQIRKMVILW